MSRAPLSEFFTRHAMALRKLCRVAFALGVFVIVVLSLLPGDELPDVKRYDKIAHFLAYAGVGALGVLGYPGRTAAAMVLAGMTALGGALEIGQMLVPGRSADILDLGVNGLGALTGYVAARLAGRAVAASRA